MTNNKGITLIALVVTIIVLLILAGVTLAMLTGQNGILTRTNDAQIESIRGQVREEVSLAMQSAKLQSEIYATQSNDYTAGEHVNTAPTGITNGSSMKEIMAEDLTSDKGYTLSATDASSSTTAGTIEITYTTKEYQNAMNNSDAKIKYTVTVTGRTFSLSVPTFAPEGRN